MSYRFDERWQEDATLDDGTRIHMRLVCATDKPLMLEAWARVSPESRYRRFLCAKSSLSEAELHYLTEVDNVNHVAIGASWQHHGVEQAIGVARFVRLPDRPEAAEPAIVVTDDAQGRGLGRLLLTRLAAAALERGVERFTCQVLASNEAMRALLHELAPGAVEHPEGPVVQVEMSLADVAEALTPAAPRDSPLRRLLRLFAEGALRLRDTLTRG